MNQSPTRDLELEYNISFIKEKIDEIIVASTGSYQRHDKNDIFNTYRIGIVNGLLVGNISVTLKKIDDNKTHWVSEILNAAGSKADPSVLARMQDEFLTILSKALTGEEVNRKLISENKSGCLGVLVLVIALSGLMAFTFFA